VSASAPFHPIGLASAWSQERVSVRERLSVYPCASVCQCNSEVQTEIPEPFPGSHVTRDNARRKHGRDSNPVILLKVA
jgi:hypothetical protein